MGRDLLTVNIGGPVPLTVSSQSTPCECSEFSRERMSIHGWHTKTHAHKNTRTQRHIRTHTRTPHHAHTHIPTHTHIQIHTTCQHTNTNTHAGAHTCTHQRTHTRTQTQTHLHPHTYTHTYTHTHTLTRTHTHTHSLTRTHTHTHTHTHARQVGTFHLESLNRSGASDRPLSQYSRRTTSASTLTVLAVPTAAVGAHFGEPVSP
jgi:hypothetical protein